VKKFIEIEDRGGSLDLFLDYLGVGLGQLQAETHIVENRHVRIERIVLEHHGDVALFRGHLVDDPPTDGDLAAGHFFKTGDHSEQRGLSATGRTDQDGERLIRDVDADPMKDLHGSKGFADIANRH